MAGQALPGPAPASASAAVRPRSSVRRGASPQQADCGRRAPAGPPRPPPPPGPADHRPGVAVPVGSRRELLAVPLMAGLASSLGLLGPSARAAEPFGEDSSSSSSSSSGDLGDLLEGNDSDSDSSSSSSSADEVTTNTPEETPLQRKKRIVEQVQKEYDRQQLGEELVRRTDDFVTNAWQTLE